MCERRSLLPLLRWSTLLLTMRKRRSTAAVFYSVCRDSKKQKLDAGAILQNEPENLDALLILAESRLAQPQINIGFNPLAFLNDIVTPLDRYVAQRPNDVNALRMRAHAKFLSGLGWTFSIPKSAAVFPESYFFNSHVIVTVRT